MGKERGGSGKTWRQRWLRLFFGRSIAWPAQCNTCVLYCIGTVYTVAMAVLGGRWRPIFRPSFLLIAQALLFLHQPTGLLTWEEELHGSGSSNGGGGRKGRGGGRPVASREIPRIKTALKPTLGLRRMIEYCFFFLEKMKKKRPRCSSKMFYFFEGGQISKTYGIIDI